ncbi:TCPH [Hepatospora eriocheir]|uniref:CCT-eta n=1 Tax=Hepatospora eriocheir TaxID=1081669 RepID=A0A1X0QBL1_9MICR|nr:TCPH [Hepatospora eriocheir]
MNNQQLVFQTEKVEDCRTGKRQVISNIETCEKIEEFMGTTLGPYGLDKLFYGEKTIITNDGATIMDMIEFDHPIGRILASMSKSQDSKCGDGTTSIVLLGCEILRNIKKLLADNFEIKDIVEALRTLKELCGNKIEELVVEYNKENLVKLAETCMNSKNVRNNKSFFSKTLVKNIHKKMSVDSNINFIYQIGGSFEDSFIFNGIAFEKTFTYAGYEQQPKMIENPKIAFINIELELRSEKGDTKFELTSVDEYKRFVDAEYKILTDKLDVCIESGVNVVLSSQPIGDIATQYFAKHNVFCAGRVENLDQIATALGGKVTSIIELLFLGSADLFEEKQLGNKRFNFFTKKKSEIKTFIVRAPTTEILSEVERSLHDTEFAIRSAVESKKIITGGGSVEMELSKAIREYSITINDNRRFIYAAIGQALEKIPTQLSENFGQDAIATVQRLRMFHSENPFYGVTIGEPADMKVLGVFEPLNVKLNAILGAFEIAELIIQIDGTLISK